MHDAHTGKRFDAHTWITRTTKRIVLIVLVALVVKFGLLDSTAIKGNQMSPALQHGDNVLVFRSFSLPLFQKYLHFTRNTPVIFDSPDHHGKRGSLRIAAISGDTVRIDSAQLYVNGIQSSLFRQNLPISELVPEDYSSRDFLSPWVVPSQGDTFRLDDLSIRDFFFTLSIIRQEIDKSPVALSTTLLLDDSITNDYIINGFALYSGSFDAIPDHLKNNWFFWLQLNRYLQNAIQNQKVEFRFAVTHQEKKLHTYVVRKSYVFLLADNWIEGLDSRYFGPVQESLIIGRPFMVWWSRSNTSGLRSIRISRIGRMIL